MTVSLVGQGMPVMDDSEALSKPVWEKTLSDLIRELIALQNLPLKKRDFEKVRRLESEITLKRKILERAIRKLKPLYPDLSPSELEQRSEELYAEKRALDEERSLKKEMVQREVSERKEKEAAVAAAARVAELKTIEQQRHIRLKESASALKLATKLVRSGQVSKCHCIKGVIYDDCSNCGGLGYIAFRSVYRGSNPRCMTCNGSRNISTTCPRCNGASFVVDSDVVGMMNASTVLAVKRLLDNPVASTVKAIERTPIKKDGLSRGRKVRDLKKR